jgi:hypothetical protein
MQRSLKGALWTGFLAIGVGTAGCQYRLQGVVEEGSSPGVEVLDKSDPHLEPKGYGLTDAVVEISVDPDAAWPKRMAPVRTDGQGRFSVPVDVFGVDWMEYKLGVLVHHPGYRPQWAIIDVPSGDKRVRVQMTPGVDVGRPNADIIQDTLRQVPDLN